MLKYEHVGSDSKTETHLATRKNITYVTRWHLKGRNCRSMRALARFTPSQQDEHEIEDFFDTERCAFLTLGVGVSTLTSHGQATR
jgi:hypothetical protein